MVPELIGRGPRGPRAEERSKQVGCPVCSRGPAARRVLGRVQVCVDLVLQQAVSKETGVCCSHPGGKLLLQDARPRPTQAFIVVVTPLSLRACWGFSKSAVSDKVQHEKTNWQSNGSGW